MDFLDSIESNNCCNVFPCQYQTHIYCAILSLYLCACVFSLQSDPMCIACRKQKSLLLLLCIPYQSVIAIISWLLIQSVCVCVLFFSSNERQNKISIAYMQPKIKWKTNDFFVFRFVWFFSISMSDIREFQIRWKRDVFFKNRSMLSAAKGLVRKSMVIGKKNTIGLFELNVFV